MTDGLITGRRWTRDELTMVLGMCARFGDDGTLSEDEKGAKIVDLQQELVAEIRAKGCMAMLSDVLVTKVSAYPMISADARMVQVQWRPSTLMAEIFGGPSDGDVVEVDRPGAPLRVDGLIYRLSGWHEDRRTWIYSLQH